MTEEKRICQACAHFVQHYSRSPGGYHRMEYGHCGKSVRKIRRRGEKACGNFAERDEKEERADYLRHLKGVLPRIADEISALADRLDAEK